MTERVSSWFTDANGDMKCNVHVSNPTSEKHAKAAADKTVPDGYVVLSAFKYATPGWYSVRSVKAERKSIHKQQPEEDR